MNNVIKFLCLNALLIGSASLAMDIDPFAQGDYLHNAAKAGNLKQVQELLDAGAPIDAKDDFGCTPLMKAAQNDHTEICQLLIDRNAQVDARDHCRRTNLATSAYFFHKKMCPLLLDNKAEVDAKDKDGKSPLALAAQNGYKVICQLLIDRKAQVDAKDNSGRTPLIQAAMKGRKDVCQLLIDVTIKQMDKAAALTLLGMRKFNRATCMNGMDRNVIQLIARHVIDAETKRLFAPIDAAKYEDLFAQINAIEDEPMKNILRAYALQQLKMDQKANNGDSHE